NVRRVLFVSSGGAVYGEQEAFPAPESHPTNPVSPYGVSKRAGELYAFFYQAEYQLPFVALRYANVYGPRQDPHGEAGVVAIFTGRMLGAEPVTVNGDGKQTRDYVYVGDVARANLLALECTATGPFHSGTGSETDVSTLARLLLKAPGRASGVRPGRGRPTPPRGARRSGRATPPRDPSRPRRRHRRGHRASRSTGVRSRRSDGTRFVMTSSPVAARMTAARLRPPTPSAYSNARPMPRYALGGAVPHQRVAPRRLR